MGVVLFRTAARPLLMETSPQLMSRNGMVVLTLAMTTRRAHARRGMRRSGLRSNAMAVMPIEPKRTRRVTRSSGVICRTAMRIKRKDERTSGHQRLRRSAGARH